MRLFFRSAIAGLCLSGMLSSCYFNSTGYICDKAKYQAQADTADLNARPNPVVYQNGQSYYIELPRYRYGTPVKLHYSAFGQDSPAEPTLEARGMGMFAIPADYAMYLTGQGPKSNNPVYMTEVPNASEIKMLSKAIPVVNQAGSNPVAYTYRSPNAGWLYTAAPFNWLLVDLPVTAVENAVIIGGVVGLVWAIVELEDDDCHHHHHHHHKHPHHHHHHPRHHHHHH